MAARKLADHGLSTLVLEARDRVGGRIHTLHLAGQPVEFGAEFVHGKAPILWNLLREAGLKTNEVTGTDVCVENGELVPRVGRRNAAIPCKLYFCVLCPFLFRNKDSICRFIP